MFISYLHAGGRDAETGFAPEEAEAVAPEEEDMAEKGGRAPADPERGEREPGGGRSECGGAGRVSGRANLGTVDRVEAVVGQEKDGGPGSHQGSKCSPATSGQRNGGSGNEEIRSGDWGEREERDEVGEPVGESNGVHCTAPLHCGTPLLASAICQRGRRTRGSERERK